MNATPADQAGLQENRQISLRLRSYAELLDAQGEDGFRVRAYRAAADWIDQVDEPLRDIHEAGGVKALVALPTIGDGIAAAIAEMLATGRWSQLDRLKGDVTPESLFRTLPGVGEVLADRFATVLDAQSLEDLESALRNPRMKVPGLGARRRDAILAALAERLAPIRLARRRGDAEALPPVALLLEADALYRRKAGAGELRRIAPRRFNPEGEAWLPILHLRRGDWHLTLLYSNTALAHELRRTRDWVVIFFHEGDGQESQCTVVTQGVGRWKGRRVIRGREDDCAAYYTEQDRAKSGNCPGDNQGTVPIG